VGLHVADEMVAVLCGAHLANAASALSLVAVETQILAYAFTKECSSSAIIGFGSSA
jgi:hypothetical protein